jgi:hypothetical protein
MTFSSLPHFILAMLLTVCVLAPLPASAHNTIPNGEEVSASRIMATGPLNVVVFRVSGR